MSESTKNKSSDFQSKDEAFEFLVQQSQNKALKDLWKKELEQLPDAPQDVKIVNRRFNLRKLAAVAATFIILLGSFFWLTNKEDSLPKMADLMIEESNFLLDADSATRGIFDNDENEMMIALQKEIYGALEKHDYGAAMGLYMTKEKQSQLSLNDKFYYSLSLARIEDGDYHKAIRLLEDVINKNDKLYNESLWLQGLLYLKINEPNKSKIILNKLNNNSNYQLSNSRVLLKRIAN